MADTLEDLPIFKKKPAPEVDGLPIFKKKVQPEPSSNVSKTGGIDLSSGLNPFQQASNAPFILTSEKQKEYARQQETQRQARSASLNAAKDAFRLSQGEEAVENIESYQQDPQAFARKQEPQGTWLENALKQGEIQGRLASILHVGERPTPEQLEEIAGLQYQSQNIPQSEAQKLYAEQGLGVFKDPLKGAQFLTETLASSFSALLESGKRTVPAATAIGGVAGSVVPGIGTGVGAGFGAMAGISTAGLNISTSSDILQSLRDNGVDVTDKDALIKAFSNEKKMAAIRSTALKYGIPIMAFDVASMGVAGKLIGGVAGKSIAKKIGAGLGEAAIQAVFGSAGEFSGQVAADKNVNWDDVAIEGLASIFTDIPEVVIGAGIERSKASSSNKNILKQIVTQGKEAGVQDAKINLDRDLNNGVITPEEHKEGLEYVEKVVATDEKIPAKVEGENRERSILLVEQKDKTLAELEELKAEKKKTDSAYHEPIDRKIERREERIAAIDKELKELAKKPKEDTRVLNQQTGKWEAPATEVAVQEQPVVEQDQEAIDEQIRPIADEMVKVENEMSNRGFDLNWDYDDQIQIINNRTGEQVEDVSEVPEDLHELVGKYEQAVQGLAKWGNVPKHLQEARERFQGEEAQIVEEVPVIAELVESTEDIKEPAAQVAEQINEKQTKGQRRQEGLLTEEGVGITDAPSLQPGDRVSFTNQLKEADTGEIVDIKPNGDYVVLKSNGVRNNMSPEKLVKVTPEKLESQRDTKILKETKPDIKLELVSAKELVNSKDPLGAKEKHDVIKERYKKLKQLIDCLHG